jgi:DNA-directed RNA polymerase subunit RPC12/RpoP
MSKTKMKCTTCGKWFQSANAKDVTCPECTQKVRKEKMAAKAMPPTATTGKPEGTPAPTRTVAPAPKPKPAASGTNQWLDALDDVKVAQPDQQTKPKIPSFPAPRDRGGQDRGLGNFRDERGQGSGPGGYRDRDRDRDRGPGGYRDERGPGGPGSYRDRDRGSGGYRDERGGGYRGPGGYRDSDYRGSGYRVGGGMGLPDTAGPRPRQPMGGYRDRGPRPGPGGPGERMERPRRGPGGKPAGHTKPKRPPAPPRPKREKIPPPQPFKPTEEQVKQVEARYLELAVPTEFDGIRTQIAQELSIPKSGVKKIVKELREKMSLPSWWELQMYKGSAEEMEKIRELYLPYLPLPPVGVHKQFAEQLEVKPTQVYQAIKTIRLEMNLPQYNDPALHGIELKPRKAQEEQVGDQVPAETVTTETETETPEPMGATSEPVGEGLAPALAAPDAPPTAAEAEQSTEAQSPHEDRSIEIAEQETGLTFEKVGDTTEIVGATTENQGKGE